MGHKHQAITAWTMQSTPPASTPSMPPSKETRTLRQKGTATSCKANRTLDQSTPEKTKHPSLNSTPDCLRIVDTFRNVALRDSTSLARRQSAKEIKASA
jgi:hypothetical protein